jgi:hypothetical protein
MQWEYLVELIPANKEALEARLNIVGSNGWEVIATWSTGPNQAVLLKKPKSK